MTVDRSLILLAGYPATGKTDLTNRILARHPKEPFGLVAPDDIKEEVWDEVGFGSAEEKAVLESVVWSRYYERLEAMLATGRPVITDYPFSEKQRPRLRELADDHDYRVLTVRLVGDPSAIYARSLKRDLTPTRHLGHLVNRYRPGDALADRSQADALVTLDLFLERCRTKGYDRFQLGELIEVDAIDVGVIDYPALLDRIDAFLAGGR